MRQKLRDYIFESKNRVKNQDAPVFSVTNDRGFIPSNDCFNKVVHSKDIANYKEVSPSFLCYNPSRINVGSIALNTTDQVCAVSPMYTVFGCDVKKLLPEYLLLFLKSAVGLKTINSKTLGTVRFQLKFDYLKNIDVRIPNVQEQQRIISILEEIDDLRQKQRKAIELTRQMIPALFYEMFGNPVTNSMGWDVVKLGDHSSKVGSGATPKGGDSAYKAEGIALIRSLNVRDGEFRWKDLARIDAAQASKLSNVTIEENDVLLNITGASVARVCCVPKKVLPARVNQHVCIIRTTSKVQPYFLESLLLSSSMKNKLLRIGESGATRQAITKAQVLALEIPLPPVELQKVFTQKAQECLSLLEEQEKALQKLDALFDSTLNRFFSS